MTDDRELQALERGAYHDSYSDGILDIFVGVSMVWIGVAWLWLPGVAGLAGVFPAVLVSAVLKVRKKFTDSRIGYVKWAEPRRRWEQRNLAAVLAAGIGVFLLGVAVYVFVGRSSADQAVLSVLGPGLIAWLLALLAVGLVFLMRAWRMLGYAGVLTVGGIVTAWADASPGWPLLAAGFLVTVVGIAMVAVFIRRNPVMATT